MFALDNVMGFDLGAREVVRSVAGSRGFGVYCSAGAGWIKIRPLLHR